MDSFRDADLQRNFPFLDRGYARRDGYNRPFLWSDLDLDLMRSTARWIATKNRLGIGVLANLQNYTVKTGFKWAAQPAPQYGQDRGVQELAARVTHFLRDFSKANDWPSRERQGLWKSVRDGELFSRHFPQPDGMTWHRWVEPEQVYQPLGSPLTWSWGIEHAPDDMERALNISVAYHTPDQWECVPTAGDQITHYKRNVDSCVKRGLSDFYCTGEALDSTAKLIRNMMVSGGVQAAIAWIEQFSQANVATVTTQVNAQRDQNRTLFNQPVTGKPVNYTKYEPGSIPKVGAGKEYVPSPQAVGASVHIQIVQAGLRSIGVRWCMPEYMVSGEADEVVANAMASGMPFVNAIECEQEGYVAFYRRTQWYAVRHAANSGLFTVGGRRYGGAELEELLEIHGTPPTVAITDRVQEATADEKDLQMGIVSKQILCAKRGYDWKKVQADLKEAPVTPPAPQQPTPGGGQAAGPFFPRRPQ